MDKTIRKIEAMYHFYGRDPQGRKCKECDHLLSGKYHDKHYCKCTVYGCSHSLATDWRKNYVACVLIEKPFPDGDNRIMDILRRNPVKNDPPIYGQVSINDLLEG